MDRAQILVVEDQAIVAIDIQSKLEDLGYAVIALIRSGEEAVQSACEMRPDLYYWTTPSWDLRRKRGTS